MSANGERQRLGGSGSRLMNAAVQSFTSPTTRSVVFLTDMMTSAACGDFGDLAAVVRACGGGELQVSGAGKPWSATAGGGGCFEALCVGAARVGESEPCVITAGRGLGRWHRRNRTLLPGACVCPGTGPYICRYARSRARVVNLGLCTSRRLITLHSVRVASYSSAGKSLKVARRAYTSHTSNCKLGPEGGTHAAHLASQNGRESSAQAASASGMGAAAGTT